MPNALKLLVTGGAGFVGSHLVERIAENQVAVFDDLSNGSLSNLKSVRKKVKFLKVDVSKETAVTKAGKVEGIFHLACHPRSFSFARPAKDVDGNVRSTVNMLELARKSDAKLVFTSNSGIYGEPQYLPIDEKHPIDCKTPYDVDKYAAELQIRAFARQYGLRSTICRLATVYGPRQRVNEKLGWRPAVATFVEYLLAGKSPVVFGDGEQTRDLIYVKDVADGLVKAFESKEADGEIFNLSTGVETSVNSLLNQIMTTTGKKVVPSRGPPSVGDIRRMCYSNEKARRILNFEVKHPLDLALKEYLEWYGRD
jgi:UDP-glucose 4-epimerase